MSPAKTILWTFGFPVLALLGSIVLAILTTPHLSAADEALVHCENGLCTLREETLRVLLDLAKRGTAVCV